MRLAPLFLCLGLVAGCTDFPRIDAVMGTTARNAPYPELLPIDGLLARAGDTRIDAATGPALAGRAAALRRRARGLEPPVLSAADRRRLLGALARHPG